MRIVKPKTENSLQAVLDRKASSAGASPKVAPPQVPADPVPSRQAPSRQGKRLIGGHFTPEVAKNLKILAAEEDTSVQALLEQALNLLFVKKGKNRMNFD